MIVYLLRKTANGKCYVGKTTRTLSWRWTQHRCEARLGRVKSPLYEDMRYFGVGFFEVEELARCRDQRRLNQLERKFIRLFNSVENGYNTAAHSFGGRTRRTAGSPNRKQNAETIRKIKEQNRRTWAEKAKAA